MLAQVLHAPNGRYLFDSSRSIRAALCGAIAVVHAAAVIHAGDTRLLLLSAFLYAPE